MTEYDHAAVRESSGSPLAKMQHLQPTQGISQAVDQVITPVPMSMDQSNRDAVEFQGEFLWQAVQEKDIPVPTHRIDGGNPA